MKIAVAGATGRVGRHIVDVLEERGHEPVPISRSNGVDVITSAGLAEALAGTDAMIDAATGASPEQQPARQGEIAHVPEMRTQLVAARTVAEALVDLATTPEPTANGSPVPEIAGPREESLVEMARPVAARQDENLRIDGVSNPDDPDHDQYISGGLLPSPHATLAGPTFAEWLETRTPAARTF
jgi:uncharacterized protein YbjT (DUF2867 family)